MALHGEPLRVGIASRIHIGVTHLAPEVRRALLHGSHEFRDAKRIRQPFEFDAVLFFQLEKPLVGDESVRALVVCVDAYARFLHRVILFQRSDFFSPELDAGALAVPGIRGQTLRAQNMLFDLGGRGLRQFIDHPYVIVAPCDAPSAAADAG